MARLILDSGAVIALAADSRLVRSFVDEAVERWAVIVIPAVVIAEVTRGNARDAAVNRVIRIVDEIAPVTETVARLAGRLLLHANRRNATIDALIVAEAILNSEQEGAVILTGDLDDLRVLADGHRRVRVMSI